ncbi:MAG: hypothetical protein ABH846_00610 [Patescibacteria group bacterium]
MRDEPTERSAGVSDTEPALHLQPLLRQRSAEESGLLEALQQFVVAHVLENLDATLACTNCLFVIRSDFDHLEVPVATPAGQNVELIASDDNGFAIAHWIFSTFRAALVAAHLNRQKPRSATQTVALLVLEQH